MVESWLLASSTSSNRGRVLAIYMIACFASMAFGQLFIGQLNTPLGSSEQSLPFICAALVTSLCVIPVTLIPRNGPEIGTARAIAPWNMFRLSPTGTGGSLATGILMGAVFTLLPVYLNEISGGHQGALVGRMMFMSIIGGMVLQYPAGRWSDKSDRQWVLLVMSLGLAVCAALLPAVQFSWTIMGVVLFFLGGGIFSLYPITISHSADRVSPEHLVGMTQGLILTNAVGSAIASPLYTPLMNLLGPNGLFAGMSALLLVMAAFFVWRRACRPAPEPETTFTTFPTNSVSGSQYSQEARDLYQKGADQDGL